jgi:CRP-like cAMP-binding protein
VPLTRGKVLCEADEPLRRVYFVESGAVSMVTVFEDGSTAEMATVGHEGVVGIDTLLGGEHSLGRYVVPLPGFAFALDGLRFRNVLHTHGKFRAACESYAQAFLANLPATPAIGSSNDARAGS